MKLNCDLGEGLDTLDAQVMPFIDMASVACGGHTGDETSMSRAIQLALDHNVSIGAHPSYVDPDNFGRVSISISPEILIQQLRSQIEVLNHCSKKLGAEIDYIKPHGALYNDSVHSADIMQCLGQLSTEFALPLVLPAQLESQEKFHNSIFRSIQENNIHVIFEAFADRSYTDEGTLVSRAKSNAVHSDISSVLTQAEHLHRQRGLYSESGKWLKLNAETLCVHSDSPNAVATIRALRTMIDRDA